MSKTGNFACDPQPRRCGLRVAALALAVLTAGLLASCASLQEQMKKGDAYIKGPDLIDQVRSIDLLPRRPQPVAATDQGGGVRAQTQVYNGVTVGAVEGATARSQGGGGGGGEGYELNFENTPIASVAKVVLGDILGTGYTIDPRVMGMISLSSGRPVPKSDLLYVLENALRLSGVVLVKDVQGYRLIPLGDAVGSGNLDAADAHAEPGYGVSVVPLRYVSASTLLKLIDSFATKPGTVRADTSRNMLLIQGTGAERRAAIDTVLGFDVDWMRGQSVGVFPIRNTGPEQIIAELEKILDSGEGGLSQNTVKFQPITRMNAVLVVTRKPDMLRAVETWIRRLDATDTARAGVHVYHVKYGEARQIAKVLNDIFTGGGGSFDTPANQVAPRSALDRLSASTGTSGGGLGGTGTAGTSGGGGLSGGSGLGGSGGLGGSSAGLGASSGRTGSGGLGGSSTFGRQGTDTSALEGRSGGGGGGQPLMEGVRITADQTNNTVLVYASTENYEVIARTLVQLDRQQLQVAIEATVAEVTLNDQLAYGVQFFLQSKLSGVPFSLSNVPNSSAGAATQAAGSLAPSPPTAAASGFNLLIGNNSGPNVVLDALHTVTTTKVLSNPSLVVLDNQVATLMVGSDVPISTGSATVLTANNSVVTTIDYRSIGIILRVAPRINANGSVRLEIEQEISQISSNANTTTPTFSQRKVKSAVGVQSGQTVLLAGLISEEQDTTRGGIPLFDQIQNLSDALSHQTKTGQRTELIVFIRPQIIRESQDAAFIAEELRSKLRGTLSAVPPYVPPSPKVR